MELADLKSKVAEVMAFMPSPPASTFSPSSMAMRYSPSFIAAAISQANSYTAVSVGCGVNQIGVAANHIAGLPPGLVQCGQSIQVCGNQDSGQDGGAGDVLVMSSLNPSASDYTPKITQ